MLCIGEAKVIILTTHSAIIRLHTYRLQWMTRGSLSASDRFTSSATLEKVVCITLENVEEHMSNGAATQFTHRHGDQTPYAVELVRQALRLSLVMGFEKQGCLHEHSKDYLRRQTSRWPIAADTNGPLWVKVVSHTS